MSQLGDYDIRKAPPAPSEPEGAARRLWPLVALAIAVLAAAGGYYWWRQRPVAPRPAPAAVAEPRPAAQTPRGPGEAGEDIVLPPLDQSDEVVRQLVRQLSSHPAVAAWLAGDGLVRNFVVVTVNIANGGRPDRQIRRLAPSAPFLVRGREGNLAIDPRSYARYDGYAEAIGALDARGAARLYATLKPRIEEAYRELGEPSPSFDDVLERAIVRLLRVPVLRDPVPVTPKVASYAYADPGLEALPAPQKLLLRMGPGNVRVVQQKLREIAGYLGIPESRLP